MRIPDSFGFNTFKSGRSSTVNSLLITFPDVDKPGKENNMNEGKINNPIEM